MPAAPIYSALHITYSSDIHRHSSNVFFEVPKPPLASSDLKCSTVVSARILVEDEHLDRVIELALDNSKAKFEFYPGDTIGIIPENDEIEVESLLQRLNVLNYANNVYTLRWIEAIANGKETFPLHIPTVGSLREVFQHFVDIRRVLSKSIIGTLGEFTRDCNERLMIERICKDKDTYSREILQENVSILRFLQRFPSCHPPVTSLLQNLPKLMPRPYSVCNSPSVDSSVIKICFNVVKYSESLKGVTTGWLEKLIENFLPNTIRLKVLEENRMRIDDIRTDMDKVYISTNDNSMDYDMNGCENEIPVYLRQTAFRLPVNHSVPIVMIATGTGIAPFIGFLQERQATMERSPRQEYGNTRMYYGCRYSDKDFLYKDELDGFLKCGALSKLNVTFSREQKNNCKYVQDSMELDKTDLTHILLRTPTVFYICGSNAMAKSVESFFCNCIKVSECIADVDAKNLMKDLKKQNKYKQDVWL